jgi:hypothetical protein
LAVSRPNNGIIELLSSQIANRPGSIEIRDASGNVEETRPATNLEDVAFVVYDAQPGFEVNVRAEALNGGNSFLADSLRVRDANSNGLAPIAGINARLYDDTSNNTNGDPVSRSWEQLRESARDIVVYINDANEIPQGTHLAVITWELIAVSADTMGEE